MVRPETQPEEGSVPSSEVERRIRWSLQEAYADAEPSPEVWPRVLARVKDMCPSKSPRQKRRLAVFPLGSLLQAAIISMLLLAFGLGGDQGVAPPGAQYALSSTPPGQRSVTSEAFPADTLRKSVLLKMERGQAQAPQRRGFAAGLDQGW